MSESRSVVSDSLQPHGLYRPWNSPGQNTGVGNLSPLQGIFPTQGLNPGLLHCRQILYQLSHKGSPSSLKAPMIGLFIPLRREKKKKKQLVHRKKPLFVTHSVMADSATQWTELGRLFCPWDFPGMNTGMGCHSLLQWICLTQGSNWVFCIADRFFTTWATREAPLYRGKTIKCISVWVYILRLKSSHCFSSSTIWITLLLVGLSLLIRKGKRWLRNLQESTPVRAELVLNLAVRQKSVLHVGQCGSRPPVPWQLPVFRHSEAWYHTVFLVHFTKKKKKSLLDMCVLSRCY